MNRSISLGLALVTLFMGISSASASGVSSGGSDWQRQVDQSYEEGKAIYQGRAPGAKKIDYCIDFNGERVELKRKTIKQFRKESIVKFANSLYDCANPESLIGLTLPKSDFGYVIYYLNKRFRLKLAPADEV